MSDVQPAGWSYRTGDWFGIFGQDTTVLLPSSERERVAALWRLSDAGAGFEEILDALLANGLSGLPGFVLIGTAGEGTKVLLRGSGVRASVAAEDGEQEFDADASATWVERTLTGVTALTVSLPGAEDAADAAGRDFGIDHGLVRVGRIDRPEAFVPQAPADTDFAAGAAESDSFDRPDDADHAEPAADDHADHDDHGSAPGLGDLPPPPSFPPPSGPPSTPPANLPPGPPPSSPPPGFPPAPGDDAGDPAAASADATPSEPSPFEDSAEQPVEQDDEAPLEESIGEQYESEQFEQYEQTGSEPSAQPDPLTEELPELGDSAAAPSAPEPGSSDFGQQAPPPAPMGSWTPDGGFAGQPEPPPVPVPPSAPPFPGDAAPAGQPAGPGDEGHDHDGMTQIGFDRSEFARQQPGIPGQPPAPQVTQQPVAKLVISNGETVDVDRVVLVGRAPEARRFTSTEQPRLVTVPSPLHEISSTHIEIRPGSGVDHGTAVVTDMGSTNGTVLVQPGLGPEELSPGIAVQLIPGAVINLGDGLTIQVVNP